MSTQVDLFDNMPDEYKELLAQLEPEANISQSSGMHKLSIRGGVFRKVVGGQEVAELEARSINVILVKTAPISRTYYAGQYVAGQNAPPTCWSADTNGGRPADDVGAEGRQSAACFDCPQNIKGSGQGESRACRYQQRVAILLADADGNVVSDTVYQLILPATSVFGDDKKNMGLQTYARFLNSMARPAPLASVITEIRFDTDSSTPKLLFKPVRPVSQPELSITLAVQKTPETLRLVTMSVGKKEEHKQLAHTPTPEKAESKPKTEAVEEEDAPEVKKAKKPSEAPADIDLASLLDAFDD